MGAYIVIVDDDPDISGLISYVLKGDTVWQATNGVSGLELIRREHPDLVILDMAMPGMTGVEVAQQMAADPTISSIPILFLSGRTESVDIEAGLRAGGTFYIGKPFELDDLVSHIRALLASLDRPWSQGGYSEEQLSASPENYPTEEPSS